MTYRSPSKFLFASALLLCPIITASAADPSGQLKQTLEDIDVGNRWFYNDWEAAKAAAQKSKKPILALFR